MTDYYGWNSLFYVGVDQFWKMLTDYPSGSWSVTIEGQSYSGDVAIEFGVDYCLLHSDASKTSLSGVRSVGHVHAGDTSDHIGSDSYNFLGCDCVSTDRLVAMLYVRKIDNTTHAPLTSWARISLFDPATYAALGFSHLDAAWWAFTLGIKRRFYALTNTTYPNFFWKNIGYILEWDNISGTAPPPSVGGILAQVM